MSKPNNYAFIDSQNLNLGIQKMGWKLDWRKFREFLRRRYHVSQAYMFIGYVQENEALYEQLHESGYLIVLKPTVEASSDNQQNGNEVPDRKASVKGNTDADMVLYALKELPHYDKAILVTGDGDFFSTIEYLIQNNKLLHVLTPNWQYSSLLKEFESYIVRLDTMKKQLAYRDHRAGARQKSKTAPKTVQ